MQNPTQEAGLHFLDYWRVIRIRWPFIVLVFITVVLTAATVTYFSPREYASSAKVEIRQGDFLMQIFTRNYGPNTIGPQRGDPRFLTTQFEILQTTEILYPVIQRLNLIERFRDEYGVTNLNQAYFLLRKKMQVRDIRNTDLIQITVYTTDPQLSADIANAIAEEYRKVRIQQVEEWVNRSLVSLQAEVEKQRQEVARLRDRAAEIRNKYGIIDLNPDQIVSAQQAGDQVFLGVEQSVSEERLRVTSLRARNNQLQNLSDSELMRNLANLDIRDPQLEQLFAESQRLAAEEAKNLNAGLGVNHPTVRAIRGMRSEVEQQISKQVAALRASFANQLRLAEESLKKLEGELEQVRAQQQDSKSATVEYIEAKSAYIQALSLLEQAETRLSSERMQLTMPQSPAIVWEKAEPSAFPARPRVMLNIALGVMVGLMLGVGAAFFMEYLDTSVKTLDEVEQTLNLPVLAVIPRNNNMLPGKRGLDKDSEAYRILRTNVEFNRKNPDANTFAVVSGGAGEGKSTTIANLAFTFAQGGYNTLVIDADLRRPTQHKIFNLDNNRGLTDFLLGDVELEDVIQISPVLDNLYVMTSGDRPGDVVAMLNSQRMDYLLRLVKERFDAIFIDAPPILGVSDASVICSLADLTIIVVQHRRFPRSMLVRVKKSILNVGGNILGVVLNNVDVRHDQHYEYYTNYYKYYSPSRREYKGKGDKPSTDAQGGRQQQLASVETSKDFEY